MKAVVSIPAKSIALVSKARKLGSHFFHLHLLGTHALLHKELKLLEQKYAFKSEDAARAGAAFEIAQKNSALAPLPARGLRNTSRFGMAMGECLPG